jgi:hypothetical protein
LNVTPFGRVPLSETVAPGDPVAVTAKVPLVPTLKAVDDAEVNAGG